MQIPLNKFEQYISENILSKGLSYFKNGRVHEPGLLSPGEYEFIVEENQPHTVHLSLSNGMITGCVCNCPYDTGPVCKHVAAAIFYLQQDVLRIHEKSRAAKSKPRKKRKTIADRVNELLEQASHDELKQFIREKTEQDRAFRNMFMASFARLNSNETRAMYVKQVKSVLQAASGRQGFIGRSAAGQVAMAVAQLLGTARKQIEAGNYGSAFFISTAVMEQMTRALQFADDSNGDIGGSVQAGYEILDQLAQIIHHEPLRKQILEYCLAAFDRKIFDGWDWHTGILQIAARLVKTEEESNRILEQTERVRHSEYEAEEVQRIKYEVLRKTRGEAAANQYSEQHIANPNLRRQAIEKAIAQKDFDRANQLAWDGVEHDREDKPGLAKEWYDWLLKTAQAQNNTEKTIEYARYLLVDGFREEQDYYRVLKSTVKPENWKGFIEKVVEDISTKKRWNHAQLIPQIFIREQWWDRLLQMLKKDPDLRTIAHYEKHLPKKYAPEIIDLYAAAIMNYMEAHVGRKHYQTACRYFRKMIKAGGRDKANSTISALREKYPQRTALMEELDKV